MNRKKHRDKNESKLLASPVMEKAKADKQIEMKLEPSLPEIPIQLFNRFKIVQEGQFKIIYLGCVLNGELMNSFIAAISSFDVETCYQNSKNYIAGLGDVSVDEPKDWNIPRSNKEILIANWVNFTHTPQVGELMFSNVIFHDIASLSKGAKKASDISCRRVVIARVEMPLYRQFIGNFFNGLED